MMTFATIVWDMNPEIFPSIFENLPLHPRWYGILFAIAFMVGFKIEENIFAREKLNPEWVDSLFMTVLIGTILGARLGHVFFYGWPYYSQHPEDILKIWEGGLASHGAVIGVIFSLWIWSKKVSKKSWLWILDRTVLAMAFGGSLVRLGNFFNSEIYGKETGSSIGVIFTAAGENLPRHPTQLYEAFSYLSLFFIMWYLYWKTDKKQQTGYLFGLFMIVLWSLRFFIEFLKEAQVEGREDWVLNSLNTGQILSIPLVLTGVWLMFRKSNKQNK